MKFGYFFQFARTIVKSSTIFDLRIFSVLLVFSRSDEKRVTDNFAPSVQYQDRIALLKIISDTRKLTKSQQSDTEVETENVRAR